MYSGVPTEFVRGQSSYAVPTQKLTFYGDERPAGMVLCSDTESIHRSYHMLNFKVTNLAVYM